jgi:hypothetical protein
MHEGIAEKNIAKQLDAPHHIPNLVLEIVADCAFALQLIDRIVNN